MTKLFTPLAIVSGGTLVSTNVGTTLDPAAYNPATAYAEGDRCVSAEQVWQSNDGANTGHTPAADSEYWTLVGAINKLAMFDRRVGSQTVNEDTIEVVLDMGQVTDTISILNVDASSITLVQEDPVDGTVHEETQLLAEPVADPWEWCFFPITRRTSALFVGIKPYEASTLTITIDNTGGDAACGALLVGQAFEPGLAQWNASDGIQDYSVIKADSFGVRDIVERDYADDAEFIVEVRPDMSPRFRRILAEQRAKPTVVILADHRPDAQYYGLLSFRRVLALPNKDIFNVSSKGFT